MPLGITEERRMFESNLISGSRHGLVGAADDSAADMKQ